MPALSTTAPPIDARPPAAPRRGKDLLDAARAFARESPARSVAHLASTVALLLAAAALAAAPAPGPARLALRIGASLVEGLLTVRLFILYHDHLHGALLRSSPVAALLFRGFGVLALTPASVWRQTHNYHHAHTAQLVGSHVGSYPVMTTAQWREATPRQRLLYRAARHPLNMLLGVLTVFGWGMCLSPLLRDPRRHVAGGIAVALHVALAIVLVRTVGAATWALCVALPLAVACALGAYLFYAQHNFPGMHVEPRATWDYVEAALRSSSHMPLGPLLAYFTGDIGLHHVHHLHAGIPFYRLREAMAALPELQSPSVTTLRPRDVAACLRLALWDAEAGRMLEWGEVSVEK